MSKPNSSMTVAQMKAYIREKKINHPEVRLGMKRGDMIAGLKKAGHWDDSKSEKKPPKTKNPAKKKAVPKGSHRMPDGSIMKDEDHKGALPKKESKNESPQRQETTKATTTDALFNMGMDISSMIGNLAKQEDGTYLASLPNILAYTTGDRRVYDEIYYKIHPPDKRPGHWDDYMVKYNLVGNILQDIVIFHPTTFSELWMGKASDTEIQKRNKKSSEMIQSLKPNPIYRFGPLSLNQVVDRRFFLSAELGEGRGRLDRFGTMHGPYKISGTLNGKNYKYLRSWKFGEMVGVSTRFGKLIPHFDDSQPSWWKMGTTELIEATKKKILKEFDSLPLKKMTKKQIQEKFNHNYPRERKEVSIARIRKDIVRFPRGKPLFYAKQDQ